jgi:drug/metabolite transporter (DMT)-like permease
LSALLEQQTPAFSPLIDVSSTGSGTPILLVHGLAGDALELASAVSWAACLAVSALVVRTSSVLGFVTMMTAVGTVLLLPFGFVERGYTDVATWSAGAWFAAVWLSMVSTTFAFVIFFWAVRRFGPSLASIISYLAPPAGVVIAFLVLGERPSALQVLGALVILAGVAIATRRAPANEPARVISTTTVRE